MYKYIVAKGTNIGYLWCYSWPAGVPWRLSGIFLIGDTSSAWGATNVKPVLHNYYTSCLGCVYMWCMQCVMYYMPFVKSHFQERCVPLGNLDCLGSWSTVLSRQTDVEMWDVDYIRTNGYNRLDYETWDGLWTMRLRCWGHTDRQPVRTLAAHACEG